MSSIKIKNLSKSYGSQDVLKDFNLSVKKGQIVEIRGKSGLGKSTLFRCISDLEEFDGEIKSDGNVTMKHQNARMLPWLNAKENIELPLRLQKRPIKHHQEKIIELSKKLGIEQHLNKNSEELSGGQRQRVALIRALIDEAEILLLDEPFSSLDDKNIKKVKEIMLSHRDEEDVTILYSTQSQGKFHFPDRKIKLN